MSGIRFLSIRFSDEGNITIDWADEDEMQKEGGTIYSTYITPSAQQDPQIAYWTKELMQDMDELLGHVRKLVE